MKHHMHAFRAALGAALLLLTLSCVLAPSCSKQGAGDSFLTACPGTPGGAVDTRASALFGYVSSGPGSYTVSLCDCGEYSSAAPNPWFKEGTDDPASSAHYRYFFPDGPGEDAVLWFFNPPQP